MNQSLIEMIAGADVEGRVPKSRRMKTKIMSIHAVVTTRLMGPDRTGKHGGSMEFVTSGIRFNGHNTNVA